MPKIKIHLQNKAVIKNYVPAKIPASKPHICAHQQPKQHK